MNPSVALSDLIHEIESKNTSIINQIKSENSTIYTPSTEDSGLPYIKKSLDDLWYTTSCDGRQTQTYIGVVKCSHKSINLIKELNGLKDDYASLKNQITDLGFNFNESLSEMTKLPGIRERLKLLGFSRLNVNHLKRKIFFHDGDVSSIRYSHYSKGKTIEKITPEQAGVLLDKLLSKNPTSESLITQRSLLGNHPHSIPLVIARPISPLIKVNIKHPSGNTTFCTALPIFVADDNLSAENLSFFPTATKTKKRKVRSDNQIESEVFLSALNIFRKSHNTA